jgi:hypothetical protein
MSIPSQAALTHLRSIKPNDGWKVEKDATGGMKLLRRNVPLVDNSFLDIHYDSNQNVVVGVLTQDGETCQVLVDESGRPVSGVRIVSVSTYNPNSARNTNFSHARAAPRTPTTTRAEANTNATTTTSLSPAQNQELIKYALGFVLFSILARLLSDSLSVLYVLALVLLYVYGLQTCPSMSSFDAKQQLKRVLRGENLPEDHPDKPKGFLEQMATRLAASVTAELATFPGYEVTLTPFAGAAILAEVRVPTAKMHCYWVGAFGKWHYVYSREISTTDRQHYD